MIKRNPEIIKEDEVLDLFKKAASDKKSDKADARKAAQKLKHLLSDNKFYYWTIIKKYTNLRHEDIDVVIQKAISIPSKHNPNNKKNPVRTLNKTGEVTIKYNGNKIIFDGKDAKSVIQLVRGEYPTNKDLQTVLG